MLENEEESWEAASKPVIKSAPPAMADDEVAWDAAPIPVVQRSPAAATTGPSASPSPRQSTARTASANSSARPKGSSQSTRVALLLGAAALLGGAWYFLGSKEESEPETSTQTPAATIQPARSQAEAPESAKPDIAPKPAVEAAQTPTIDPPPAASVPAAPEADPKLDPKPDPSPASADVIVVTVSTVPPDARFYYKGKSVGRSPFRIELKPGERRAFEIGRPGYFSRKVVVDGKKKEFTVTMRPEAT